VGFWATWKNLTDFRERWKPVWIHACSRWFAYSKCGAIIWHQHKQSPSLSLEVICQNHTAVSLILKNISTEAERNETNFSSSRAKYLLIESKYKEFPHKPSYLASAMFQTLWCRCTVAQKTKSHVNRWSLQPEKVIKQVGYIKLSSCEYELSRHLQIVIELCNVQGHAESWVT